MNPFLPLSQTYPGWTTLGPVPLCPAAPERFLAGVGGTAAPSPGPDNHSDNYIMIPIYLSHCSQRNKACKNIAIFLCNLALRLTVSLKMCFSTNLHASGSVPQTSICSHFDGSVCQLLCQLQDSCMVGYGLVKVPLRVVGTAQIAVRSRLLTTVLQSLQKDIITSSLLSWHVAEFPVTSQENFYIFLLLTECPRSSEIRYY